MKIIKQSVELFPACDPDELSVAKHLEEVARTCYKSEDKITDGSAFKFINGLVKNRHLAMLEHYIITCEVHKSVYDDIIWYRSQIDNIHKGYDLKYLRLTNSRNRYLVSGSLTTFFKLYLDYFNADQAKYTCLTKNDHFETFLYKLISKQYEHIFQGEIKYPFDCYILNNEFKILNQASLYNNLDKETYLLHDFRTIRFITDRAIANEIVRSRTASYAQESSRYCNYSNDKFGNEITIIEPSLFWTSDDEKYKVFINACEDAEAKYIELIKLGAKPEEARCVLPHATKTELIMTCRLQELNMFLKLRSGERVHPQLKELIYDLINLYGYSF